MRTLSILGFLLFFCLSGLGVFLAERLVERRGQAFLRSYSRHLALWNAHALVQITQFILGGRFLPPEAWAPLGTVTAPIVFLFLGASLYFLILFAAQVAGRLPPRLFTIAYGAVLAGILVAHALAAGAQPSTQASAPRTAFSLSFLLLKMAAVLAVSGVLLFAAAKAKDLRERRSLGAVAWTYLAGFLLFQLAVAGALPIEALPGHEFWPAFLQVGFHFPVLAALERYAGRRAAAGPPVLFAAAGRGDLIGIGLTPREAEVVSLVMRGFSNKEIEDRLFISLETVKKHLSSIYRKLGVRNRLQLSLRVLRSF